MYTHVEMEKMAKINIKIKTTNMLWCQLQEQGVVNKAQNQNVTRFWKTRLIAQKLKFELLVPLNSSIFAEQNGGQDAVIACTVAEL